MYLGLLSHYHIYCAQDSTILPNENCLATNQDSRVSQTGHWLQNSLTQIYIIMDQQSVNLKKSKFKMKVIKYFTLIL